MRQDNTDEILGITRCVQCGQRLDDEVECPFCTVMSPEPRKRRIPKWVFLTACFFTSPVSIYGIIKTDRLTNVEKVLASSGCLVWVFLFGLWF